MTGLTIPTSFPRPNRRTLVVVVATLVAAAVVWVALVRPSMANLAEVRAELVTNEAKLAERSTDLAMVRAGNVVPSEVLNAADAAAGALLPSVPPSVEAAASVWQRAEAAGLKVVTLSAGSPVRPSTVNPALQFVSVQLSVVGDLPSIVSWIRALESGPQMAVVSVDGLASAAGGYQLNAKVLVYSAVDTSLKESLLARTGG
jgi:type II secretory pathway component PulM